MTYKTFIFACLALSAPAHAADFSFIFETDRGDPTVGNGVVGSVQGRILGLADIGTSRAQHVYVDVYSPASGLFQPVEATAWFSRFENSFTVSGGNVVSAAFHADNDFNPALDRLYINIPIFGAAGTNYASLGSNNRVSVWNNKGLASVQFAPLTSAVPEPATWMMLLAGFGAVGWSMRRRGLSLKAMQRS